MDTNLSHDTCRIRQLRREITSTFPGKNLLIVSLAGAGGAGSRRVGGPRSDGVDGDPVVSAEGTARTRGRQAEAAVELRRAASLTQNQSEHQLLVERATALEAGPPARFADCDSSSAFDIEL